MPARAAAAKGDEGEEAGGVAEFFAGRSVFVTGATGFVGKVTVEKLLRSAPDVGGVYLLVRGKKGVPPIDRISRLFDEAVFDRLKEEQPDCLDKVHPIVGDLLEPHLGISAEDRATVADRCSVVIHIAATVNFNDPIKLAAKMNIVGVKGVLRLVSDLKQCDSFVHTSTAYSHTYKDVTPETFLPATYEPNKLLRLLDAATDKVAAAACPALITGHPNTYTFTKCCAEGLVNEFQAEGNVPTSVVRPSIITPAWREPYPGWTDTYNGPTGVIAAVGSGLWRLWTGHRNLRVDCVPVDIVANTLIVAAWDNWARRQPGRDQSTSTSTANPVYNCTSGSSRPASFAQWVEAINVAWARYPLNKNVMRTPTLAMMPAMGAFRWAFGFFQMVSHYLPGKMLDAVAALQGSKFSLDRFHNRLNRVTAEYRFFLHNEFKWETRNLEALQQQIPAGEVATFNTSLKDMHFQSYIDSIVLGLKKFMMKQDMSPKQNEIAKSTVTKVVARGVLVRIALLAVALRSATAAGYLRRGRLYERKTWVLLALASFVSKNLRPLIEKGVQGLSAPSRFGADMPDRPLGRDGRMVGK